ncbi:augurin isoform X1 [Phyllobates terribilis]|uniref:augurin isoform X1 n=2 Tax=Phyllobates terribilis TaxID=111132 RepID=UPI003CCA8730
MKKVRTNRGFLTNKMGLLSFLRQHLGPSCLFLVLLVMVLVCPDVSSGNKLRMMLQKREAKEPAKTIVSVDGNKANEFLNTLKRSKRQLWDRSRPEVQQWYQHFLYMGFDETKYEDDADYWMNQRRAGTEYYGGFHHHHYDEDAPIGPRNPNTFRHGASVNYDDY